jgi:PAS domain S-box-containing protein
MVWQQTPYTLLLVATTAFLFGFAAYLWSLDRSRPMSGTFLGGLLLFAGGSWTGLYTLRLSAATLPGKLLWIRLEFVAVLALSVIWLAYVVRYTGRTKWLTRRVFGPLTAIAAGIELLVLTDGTHHLVYREYGLRHLASFTVFDPVYGPAFAVYLGFSYTLLGASLLFLATAAVHARGVFRWQIAVLVLFSVVPGAAGILYVTGVTVVPGLNVAALSIVVSTAAVAVSFTRFRWTEMTPIARDRTFEAMTEAVVVLDAKRRLIDFNAAAERLLPGSGDGLMGEPVTESLPDLAGTLDGLDGTDDAASEVRRELTVSDGDDRLELDVRVSPIGLGESTGYTVLLHDITARKAAEERAEERRQKIEELHRIARDLTAARTREEVFQRAVDGGEAVLDADVCRLAVVDGDRLVPVANSGEEPADRYDPQPVDHGIAGVTFRSDASVVVDDLADTRRAVSPADPDEGPFVPDGSAPPANSEPAYRALLSAPVGDIGTVQALASEPGAFGDDDREVMELLTTHIETAVQRADAEADLRTERDRLEQFANTVSHDLRNPLNVAQGRVELLKRDAPAEHVEPIDRSLSRMDDIITNILKLAREGEAAEDADAVDLGLCVGDAWAIVDTGSAAIEYPNDLGTVAADDSRLRQLLENLFRNAIEHCSADPRSEGSANDDAGTPGDPAVTVRVGRLDDREGFYVADDGPGIPPAERGSVFEQGYTSQEEGTGLGLAIVERIADAHGWAVAVTESDAGGARFEIRTDG